MLNPSMTKPGTVLLVKRLTIFSGALPVILNGTAAKSVFTASLLHTIVDFITFQACQVQGWSKGGHKEECRLTKQIRLLMKQDWDHFRGDYYKFPFTTR